jgi:hypothetical protein
MKACRGIAALINGGSRCRQGVSLRPRLLYTRGKSPPSRLYGPQDRLQRFGEEINLTPLPGFEPWTLQSAA